MEKSKRVYDDKHFYLGELDYSDFLLGYEVQGKKLIVAFKLPSYDENNKYFKALRDIQIGSRYRFKDKIYKFINEGFVLESSGWVGDMPDFNKDKYKKFILMFEFNGESAYNYYK